MTGKWVYRPLSVIGMLVALVATACDSEAPSGQVTLWTEFTAGGEAAGMDELIESFQSKQGGVTIDHRQIDNEEFFTVIRTGLVGDQPPDVLQYEGYQQTRDFAKAGKLVDLTEWWNQRKDLFVLQEAGRRACSYNGRVYCVPYTFHTGWQIYYNPQILKEHDVAVPSTYEEFLAAAERLQQEGVTPIAFGGKEGWPGEHWYMAFLVQRCGVDRVYSAIDGTGAKFTDSCFVRAAGDYQNLQEKGYFSEGAASDDYATASAIFLSGKAAFFQTGSWFTAAWEDNPPTFDVGIMPFPRMNDAVSSDDIIGAVTHVFAIPTDAKNKLDARKFLDFLATNEAGETWASHRLLSMIGGAVDTAAPEVTQQLWQSVQQADATLPWIENELPPGVGEDKVYNGTVALLTGDMTPEEFSSSIQAALEKSRGAR